MIRAAFVHITPSLTKSLLTDLDKNFIGHPLYDVNPALKTKPHVRLVEHWFICSFKKVPITRVMDSLPHFRIDRERNEFIWTTKQIVPKGGISGYNKVFVIGTASYLRFTGRGTGFFVRNLNRGASDRPEAEYWVKNNCLIGPDRSESKVGEVEEISRHVHIRIFDVIKSEKTFDKKFTDVLKEVESEFV